MLLICSQHVDQQYFVTDTVQNVIGSGGYRTFLMFNSAETKFCPAHKR